MHITTTYTLIHSQYIYTHTYHILEPTYYQHDNILYGGKVVFAFPLISYKLKLNMTKDHHITKIMLINFINFMIWNDRCASKHYKRAKMCPTQMAYLCCLLIGETNC